MHCSSEFLWRPLLELFHQRRPSTRTNRRSGYILSVSSATPHAVIDDGTPTNVQVMLPWDRRLPHIVSVVNECTAFRVSVECVDDTIMRIVLDVNDSLFLKQMNEKYIIDGEVSIVGLLSSCWKDAIVLSCPPDTAAESSWESYTLTYNSSGLYDHQIASLKWMSYMEDSIDKKKTFDYNGNILITNNWYVDAERECVTQHPSVRTAEIAGGILGDWPGAGKTATVLVHCVNNCFDVTNKNSLFESRGTLIITPLNLQDQWITEASHFCPTARIVTMLTGRDARTITMTDLLNADIVFTTFQFLRDSRVYSEMVENTVEKLTCITKRSINHCKSPYC